MMGKFIDMTGWIMSEHALPFQKGRENHEKTPQILRGIR